MNEDSDSENLRMPSPDTYENLLTQQDETIHAIVKDILACKLEDIKNTKVGEMAEILSNFTGKNAYSKKAESIEFLRIMPEYKTTDKDTMALRLKALKMELHRRGEIEDLLIWAKLKYAREQKQNE